MKKLLFFILCLSAICGFNALADDTVSYRKPAAGQETDPIVGAITGIVKADGAGNISAAEAGDFPTLNQNTTGTAAGLSGTPTLPNGTTATTQSAGDNSTKLATTAYADTGLAAKVANDGTVNPVNLLSNGDFESWLGGTAVAPDGWTFAGSGASVAREGTIIKINSYSAKVTRSGADTQIYQQVHSQRGINYFKGRVVTLSCWVYATVASRARIALYDGVGTSYSPYHSGGSAWELLSVTRTIDASATVVQNNLGVDTGDTSAYFDGAIFVEGESKFAFAPNFPEENKYINVADQVTITGWASFTVKQIYVKKIGRRVFLDINLGGTSNSTTTKFTLPYTRDTMDVAFLFRCQDNASSWGVSLGAITSANEAYFYRDIQGAPWTNSGTKSVQGQVSYETSS